MSTEQNAQPTPQPTPAQQAEVKAQLMMGIAQLDPVLSAIVEGQVPITVPDRVKAAAKEFRDSLKEWADS